MSKYRIRAYLSTEKSKAGLHIYGKHNRPFIEIGFAVCLVLNCVIFISKRADIVAVRTLIGKIKSVSFSYLNDFELFIYCIDWFL